MLRHVAYMSAVLVLGGVRGVQIIRLAKKRVGRVEARAVITRSGEWYRVITSVKGPMQEMSEVGEHASTDLGEKAAEEFAMRYRAEVLYIDDQT